MSSNTSSTLTVNIGEAKVTLKRFVTNSGVISLKAVAGGKKVGGQRIPAAALDALAGTVVKSGGNSVKLVKVTERPANAKGRKEDENGNPIPWIPRTTATLEVALGDENFGITVEAKQEGLNSETAMLTVAGKLRSDGVGGGGRTAAPTVSLADAFGAFGS